MAITGLTKTVSTASTAVQLSANVIHARKIVLQAKKVGGDNTGNVFIGPAGLDQGVLEYVELRPGDYWEFEVNKGEPFLLSDLYLDADTSGDGVVGFYIPA